jgi:hypothetical protein
MIPIMRNALAPALACLLGGAVFLGCADSDSGPTTRPTTAYERSENAMKDPFGYSPDVGNPDDISGGSTGGLDKKGLQKDADDVLNP